MQLGIFAGGRTAEAATTRESAARIVMSARHLGHQATIIEVPAAGAQEILAHLPSIDLAFPLVAGLEPFFEIIGLPYVGSEPTTAGIAAHKGLFNDLVTGWGYDQPRYVRLRSSDSTVVPEMSRLTYPVFVKPARLGASIGIWLVKQAVDLWDAVERARVHDTEVVIEEAVDGVEVNVGVIAGENILQSPPAIAVIPTDAQFLDVRAKARGIELAWTGLSLAVRNELTETVRALTVRLGMAGALTHEHFVTTDHRVLVGEVNCLPGHMERSGFPRLLEAAGLTREDQLERLIDTALWHHEQTRSNASRY